MIRVILTDRSPASDGFPLNNDAGSHASLTLKRDAITGVDADGKECPTGVFIDRGRFRIESVVAGRSYPVYYHELRVIPVVTNEG